MNQRDFSFKRQSIFCSVRANKMTEKEQFVPAHALIHLLSGKLSVVEADSVNRFKRGDTLFVRRNTLAKFTKYPEESGEPFKTLSIFIKRSFLQDYLNREKVKPNPAEYSGPPCRVKKLPPSALMDNLFDSLRLHFDSGMTLATQLSDIKTREAILLLKQMDSSLYDSLFHFNDVGKINLEDFMCKNFVFNVPLTTLSKMTGRSLSTFKRDFKKVFDESPSRWLKKKRLEYAYYLIKEKNKAPSDVYLEVGFENLSHFSASFKEAYGRNPSSVNEPHRNVTLACAR